jgi:hypothetical protein
LKRRFYFDDNNDENEDEEGDEKDEFDNPEFFQMAQFPFQSDDSIMNCAIKVCESCFFWKFYSIEIKLKKIENAYYALQSIIDDELERKKNA